MVDSFYIAATGMHAQQQHVDTIANNVANINTMGFKKSRVDFEDLVYQNLQGSRQTSELQSNDRQGLGSGITSIEKIFTQGNLKGTGRPLDVAIRGAGFFEVLLPDGRYAYTRTGVFQVDDFGMLTNADGHQLNPSVRIPSDGKDIAITNAGEVFVTVPNQAAPVLAGKLELANFVNSSGLTPMGDNLYVASENSGDVYYGDPGAEGFGSLSQGFLEGSNVDMVEEMTNLVVAQRGYELNTRVLQLADEIWGMVNNLRR